MKPESFWTDTAVVGGAFTGLSAVRALARRGARVAVLEAGKASAPGAPGGRQPRRAPHAGRRLPGAALDEHPVGFDGIHPRHVADVMLPLFFKPGSPTNESGWKDEKLDQLLVAARAGTDETKPTLTYADMQTIVHGEGNTERRTAVRCAARAGSARMTCLASCIARRWPQSDGVARTS